MSQIADSKVADDLTDKLANRALDIRMVMAIAGKRDLNAREQLIVEKLKDERGESLFSDMLYALTHKTFPARQAKTVWAEIGAHQQELQAKLGRDPGLMVATHDFLANSAGLLKNLSLIEENKLNSLADIATQDGLTGLMDKRTFLRKVDEELLRQHRYGGRLSLVMIDIDHFKKLNDTFGHADGDIILSQVAEMMKAQARSSDMCARYGGEEFGILLIGVGLAAGKTFAERLRQRIENRFAETDYKVTISAGIAASLQGDETDADKLIRAADKKLYQAKESGRNQVAA